MSTPKRIGDLLVEKGLLTQAQLVAALEEQGKTGLRIRRAYAFRSRRLPGE